MAGLRGMRGNPRHVRTIIAAIACGAGVACDQLDIASPRFESVPETGVAAALGMWNPSGTDTCSKAVHDSYSTIGPDGLRYPTWHPPVDPATGCTFGHEHGRDPRGSDLYGEVGDIPFGYANQHLPESDFATPRVEDHVGHKVEWENDMVMHVGQSGSSTLEIRCDVLVKLHQGTHSPDAFTNNLHEIAYHIRCSDGTAFSATLLTPIGTPGELVAACERERHVAVGTATPPNSPPGGGKRAVPDALCVDANVAGAHPHLDGALHESWEVSASLRRADGHWLVAFNPYFQVRDPSRYFAPGRDRNLARSIELCALPAVQGRDRCAGLGSDSIPWDDPRSPFKGVRRFVDINGNFLSNKGGPNVWYTTPLGTNGSPTPFPGAIRQWIASRDNSGMEPNGAVMGDRRNYNATGVRAPN